jgi:hypothetical protein
LIILSGEGGRTPLQGVIIGARPFLDSRELTCFNLSPTLVESCNKKYYPRNFAIFSLATNRIFFQGVRNDLYECANSTYSVGFARADLGGHCLDEFFFIHIGIPSSSQLHELAAAGANPIRDCHVV